MVRSVRQVDKLLSGPGDISLLERGKSFSILAGMLSALPKANIFIREPALRRNEIFLFQVCNKE
jgi:hypothetical protein